MKDADARQKKIDAIEGLKELEDARNAEESYHYELNRRMEDEQLSGLLPGAPKVSSKDVAAKYPRAAAYLKAYRWTLASHYAKAAAGRKALEAIINGDDYNKALTDMDAEWSAHCQAHVWD